MLKSNDAVADRFAQCLAHTLHHEGGYTNDPHDPGGPTMRGVLQRVYDRHRDLKGRERRDVRSIDNDELIEIYHRNYWMPLRASELPAGVDLAVFDFGVNCGIASATCHLQAVLGVERDKHIGPITLAAAANADTEQLIEKLHERRDTRYRQLHHFWRFGRGWLNRSESIKEAALDMAVSARFNTMPPEPPTQQRPDQEMMARATERERGSVMQSTEVRTGAGVSSGAGIGVGNEIASAAEKTAQSSTPSFEVFLWSLASSPTFWVWLGIAIAGLYLILRRRRHIWAVLN